MYGAVLPVLFSIALVNFISVYVLERFLVIYYFKEPPAYDETMTMLCILCSRFIVLAGLALSFWQLGNRQIFDNILFRITTANEP